MRQRFLSLLLSLVCLYSIGQSSEDKEIVSDSSEEIHLLYSLSSDNFQTLKVCFNIFDCKGFIAETDTALIDPLQMNIVLKSPT